MSRAAPSLRVRVRPRGSTETVDLLLADAKDQVRLGGTALEIVVV